MSALTQLKLGIALAGLVLWGYGARTDVSWLRWTGIAFLALAAVLRFLTPAELRRRRRQGADDDANR
jgi:hypothetical protein